MHEFGLSESPKGDPFEKFFPLLETSFRNVWTQNADVISILYTGTPALKTDFTRTGKRTTAGALQDGKHSIRRYFINNLNDGYNLDCQDLALGYLKPADVKRRGFLTPLKFMFLTYLILGIIIAGVLHSQLPAEGD